MDFLDPKKRRAHKIRLISGYVLIGIAMALATTILLYSAYGFGIDKDGKVIQNGLVFVSTRPDPADVYLDGQKYKSQTDTRMQLPASDYMVKLQRDGYRTWERKVTVAGGDVQHFDYPILFPTKLTTTTVKQYTAAPNLVSQSLDRKWLIVQSSTNFAEFERYDLTKPKEAPITFALPPESFTPSDSAQSWQEIEWSTDDRHVLLKHSYQKSGQPQSEYLMLDRAEPLQSVNLTKALNVNPTEIALRDNAYDQYYLFDQATATLSQASLKAPTPAPYLDHVLDFKSYGSNVVLYVSDQSATAGKVSVKLRQGDDTFTLRELASSSTYLVDLARYEGDWYMVAGSTAENKAYIYKNPVDTIKNKDSKIAVPIRVFRIASPTYAKFSENGQFVLTQGGTSVGVYDAENKRSYAYQLKDAVDAPQSHISWMDTHRLQFVSAGKTIVLDYDGTNQQILTTADGRFLPVFDPDFKFMYGFVAQQSAASTTFPLTSTSLLTPADQ